MGAKCYNKKTLEIGEYDYGYEPIGVSNDKISIDPNPYPVVKCGDKTYKYEKYSDVDKEWEPLYDYYTIDRADKGGLFIRKINERSMLPEWIEADKKAGIKFDTAYEAEVFLYQLRKRADDKQ